MMSEQTLARLLGLEPGTAILLPDTLPSLPRALHCRLDQPSDDALKARPDVQAAQDRVAAMAQEHSV